MVYVFGSITTCIIVTCTILNIRLYMKWKTLKSDKITEKH
jgi:hypothetical protein